MRLKITHKKKLYRRIDTKGNPAKGKNTKKHSGASLNLEHVLSQMEHDPLMLLYMISIRDVVGLHWMTAEDLARPEEIDDEGRLIKISGEDKADKLCPQDMRERCAKELAPYTHFKVAGPMGQSNLVGPGSIAGAQADSATATVSFTMPANTR